MLMTVDNFVDNLKTQDSTHTIYSNEKQNYVHIKYFVFDILK
jgi:hypothetical protein